MATPVYRNSPPSFDVVISLGEFDVMAAENDMYTFTWLTLLFWVNLVKICGCMSGCESALRGRSYP